MKKLSLIVLGLLSFGGVIVEAAADNEKLRFIDNMEIKQPHLGNKVINLDALRKAGIMIEELSRGEQDIIRNAIAPDPAADLEKIENFGRATEFMSRNQDEDVDMRQRVYAHNYPARLTALITYNQGGRRKRCSGTLISSDTVATAGHCLFYEGEQSSDIRVYFKARWGYFHCKGGRFYYPELWNGSPRSDNDEGYDYGAIKLVEACSRIGNYLGSAGISISNGNLSPENQPAIIQGYPSGVISQWLSADKVRKISANQLFYANDTSPGMSGSGVWYDNGGLYLIGIHGYGHGHGSANHRKYNHGVRITADVYKNLQQWINN